MIIVSEHRLPIVVDGGRTKTGGSYVVWVGYNGPAYGYFFGVEHEVDATAFHYDCVEFFRKESEATYQEVLVSFREYIAQTK